MLIDTSNYAARDRTFALVRSVDPAPVFAAIYTHGHADHALGLPPFLAQAREQGWPRPHIIGHRNVAARFARYRQTNGYNALINARQFGIAPTWPMDYDDPDVVYDDALTFAAGGGHARAAPRARRDRRPHLGVVARAPDPLDRRSVHLGRAQRRQPAEGPALRRASGPCRCAPCARSSPSC